jgi:CHASE1-domain containing sensor protein
MTSLLLARTACRDQTRILFERGSARLTSANTDRLEDRQHELLAVAADASITADSTLGF